MDWPGFGEDRHAELALLPHSRHPCPLLRLLTIAAHWCPQAGQCHQTFFPLCAVTCSGRQSPLRLGCHWTARSGRKSAREVPVSGRPGVWLLGAGPRFAWAWRYSAAVIGHGIRFCMAVVITLAAISDSESPREIGMLIAFGMSSRSSRIRKTVHPSLRRASVFLTSRLRPRAPLCQ